MALFITLLKKSNYGSNKRQTKGCLHEEYCPPIATSERSPEEPQFCGEAAVDIIAVHGLDSKYHRTWSVEVEGTEDRYHWLREKLPKDIPDARVLGFEYGSSWYGDPTYTDLEECGEELLRCVIRDRRHRSRISMCPTRRNRPIIFVGHSFGGLVIKQALVNALRRCGAVSKEEKNRGLGPTQNALQESRTNYRDFLSCVAGVIFLGTPHRGSEFSYWAGIKMSIGSTFGKATNPELLKVLDVDSPTLSSLQRQFNTARRDEKLSDILLYCYYETRQVALPPYIVVSEDSACLDDAEKRSMDANHMEMNKFHSGEDPNYEKVLADIFHIYHASATTIADRLSAWKYNSSNTDSERQRLRRWLDPSAAPQIAQLSTKLGNQKDAPYTCQWIHTANSYLTWCSDNESPGFLWVYGKAGSGKSVLAGYVIDQLRLSATQARQDGSLVCQEPLLKRHCSHNWKAPCVLYFYCGVDRARENATSILATLVHQILSLYDVDEALFSMAQRAMNKNLDGIDKSVLIELLKELISGLQRVYIIIDGLEENTDYQSCLECISQIVKLENVNLALFSQATESMYNLVENLFPQRFELCITDYSVEDIQKFTESKSRQLIHRKPYLKEKESIIVTTLQKNAQGMFQWVNAALEHLEKNVGLATDVEEGLRDLPSDLWDTYEKIFSRMNRSKSPRRITDRIDAALRILAASATPLTIMELETALDVYSKVKDNRQASVSRILQKEWSEEVISDGARNLRSLLGPLIEIDSDKNIHFTHPSLRVALLRPSTPSDDEDHNTAISEYRFSAEEAHFVNALVCMAICRESALIHANSFSKTQPALVAYAWIYWAYHVKKAPLDRESTDRLCLLDSMIYGVTTEAISFLGALTDFVGGPSHSSTNIYSDLEQLRSMQRAQDSLLPAIEALSAVRNQIPVASKLESAMRAIPDEVFDTHTYEDLQGWARRKFLYYRRTYIKDETAVNRLKVDELIEQPKFRRIRIHQDVSDALLQASRHVRKVALRFAVNPVYSMLIHEAGGITFSPIHVLVYTATLLEECGSCPLWNHLPVLSDPLENFICNPSDPQIGPAKFVLQSFQFHVDGNVHKSNQHALQNRSQSLIHKQNASRPELAFDSEEHLIQVRGLHLMPRHHWLVKRLGFTLFRDDKSWFQFWVANPIGNMHIRKKLLVGQDESHGKLWENPEETLGRFAPPSIDGPIAEAIRATPGMLRILFVKYFETLLTVVGRVTKASITSHYVQVVTAKGELAAFRIYCKRFFATGDTLRVWHLLPALVLYWLRCQWWPTFGAHPMAHPWRDLLFAYRHSAAYLDLQASKSAWFWFKSALMIRSYHATGAFMTAYGAVPGAPGGGFANSFSGFYQITSLERNTFGLCFLVATLVASSNVMLYDRGSLYAIFKHTYQQGVLSAFHISTTFTMAFLAQTENLKNLKLSFGLILGQLVIFILALVYEAFVMKLLYKICYPAILPLKLLWVSFLYHYVMFFKACGTFLIFYMAYLAITWFHSTLSDPYELEKTWNSLRKASRLVESAISQNEKKRIGVYPLGTSLQLTKAEEAEEVGRAPEQNNELAVPRFGNSSPILSENGKIVGIDGGSTQYDISVIASSAWVRAFESTFPWLADEKIPILNPGTQAIGEQPAQQLEKYDQQQPQPGTMPPAYTLHPSSPMPPPIYSPISQTAFPEHHPPPLSAAATVVPYVPPSHPSLTTLPSSIEGDTTSIIATVPVEEEDHLGKDEIEEIEAGWQQYIEA